MGKRDSRRKHNRTKKRPFLPADQVVPIERNAGSFLGTFRGGLKLEIKFNNIQVPFDETNPAKSLSENTEAICSIGLDGDEES